MDSGQLSLLDTLGEIEAIRWAGQPTYVLRPAVNFIIKIINLWESWPLIEFNWSESLHQCNVLLSVCWSPRFPNVRLCFPADILITENPPELRRVSLKVLSRADRRGEWKNRKEKKETWQSYFSLFMFVYNHHILWPIYVGTISHTIVIYVFLG